MYSFWERLGLGACILILAVLAIFLFVYVPMLVVATEKCNAHGYPEANINWNFTTYCVRIIDQTQYVVPLEEVMDGSDR